MPAHDPAIGDTGNAARGAGSPSLEFKNPFTFSNANSCKHKQTPTFRAESYKLYHLSICPNNSQIVIRDLEFANYW